MLQGSGVRAAAAVGYVLGEFGLLWGIGMTRWFLLMGGGFCFVCFCFVYGFDWLRCLA